jgi:hypothetical protein
MRTELRYAHAVSDMGISTLFWIKRGHRGELDSQSHLCCQSRHESTAEDPDGRSAAHLASSSSHNIAPIVIHLHFLKSVFEKTAESKRNLINVPE